MFRTVNIICCQTGSYSLGGPNVLNMQPFINTVYMRAGIKGPCCYRPFLVFAALFLPLDPPLRADVDAAALLVWML